MNMDKALAVIDSVETEMGLEGFVETMEYINDHYDDALHEVREAFDVVKAGLFRFFEAQEAA